MNKKMILSLSAVAGSIFSGCNAPTSEPKGQAEFTKADQDTTVRLEDDFYQFSNGGWIKAHPVPADKSRYGVFDVLYDESIDNLHEIVLDALNSNAAPGSAAQRLATSSHWAWTPPAAMLMA